VPVSRTVTVPLAPDRFPYFVGSATVQPTALTAVAVPRDGTTLNPFALALTAAKGSGNDVELTLNLQPSPDIPPALLGRDDQTALPKIDPDPAKDALQVSVTLDAAPFDALRHDLRDLVLLVSYTATL